MSDRILYERHVIRTKSGRRRVVYRRAAPAADAGARRRERDGAPSATLTAGADSVGGGTDWGKEREAIPHAKRVLNNSEDLRRVRAARYSTWFRATGTMGLRSEDDSYRRMQEALGNDADEETGFAIPSAFFSNQSGILGRVKWPGVKSLDEIIEALNIKLQYQGEEIEGFDFRDVYSRWEYRYQVIETIGRGGVNSKDVISQVVVEHRAALPRRRGWDAR